MSRRLIAGVSALALLPLLSCTEESPVAPEAEFVPETATSEISFADGDAISEGEDFAFLPPLTRIFRTRPRGKLDRSLSPALSICSLGTEPGPDASCLDDPVELFAPGEATLTRTAYGWLWRTRRGNTPELDAAEFYRLQVTVGDQVLGSIDLDPRRGFFDDRDEDVDNYKGFSFRIGSVVPVFVFIGEDALCTGESFVSECDTGSIIDESGGSIRIEDEGVVLGVDFPAGALPPEVPEVSVVIERIDPDAFLAETGEECLPMFDAPQFGDCVRVTTTPELPEGSLEIPATVSICIDPSAFGLTPAQQGGLSMIRFDEGTYEVLAETDGNCGPAGVAGVGAVMGFEVDEEDGPSDARPIRLGALTSSFSRFRFALPGQMIPTDGVGTVLETGTTANEVVASVRVVDYLGAPVANATVHYATSDGSAAPLDVTTDAEGFAVTTWQVDTSTPGTRTLTASALGLFAGAPPSEAENVVIVEESVVVEVTVEDPRTDPDGDPRYEEDRRWLAGSFTTAPYVGYPEGLDVVYEVSVDQLRYRNGDSHKVWFIPESSKGVVTSVIDRATGTDVTATAPNIKIGKNLGFCPGKQPPGSFSFTDENLPFSCPWQIGNGESAIGGTFEVAFQTGRPSAAAVAATGGDTPDIRLDDKLYMGSFEFEGVTYEVSVFADLVRFRPGTSHQELMIPESHKLDDGGFGVLGGGYRVTCPFRGPGVESFDANTTVNPIVCTWKAGNGDRPSGIVELR